MRKIIEKKRTRILENARLRVFREFTRELSTFYFVKKILYFQFFFSRLKILDKFLEHNLLKEIHLKIPIQNVRRFFQFFQYRLFLLHIKIVLILSKFLYIRCTHKAVQYRFQYLLTAFVLFVVQRIHVHSKWQVGIIDLYF